MGFRLFGVIVEGSTDIAQIPLSRNDSAPTDVELPSSWVRLTVVFELAVALLLAPLIIVFLLYKTGDLVVIAKAHAPAMIGIPWAGGAAFIVVLVLRTSFGAINFKVLGVEFKGASGPIVMWVLCFLVEVAAIKTLW
jgi:hypothetical protein